MEEGEEGRSVASISNEKKKERWWVREKTNHIVTSLRDLLRSIQVAWSVE